MYHPLLIFERHTGCLLAARLRPGRVVSHSRIPLLQRDFPPVRIQLRADAGFATPMLYEFCEFFGPQYAIGMGNNSRLRGTAQHLQRRLARYFRRTGQPQRSFSSFRYRAHPWPHQRRIRYKAEHAAAGTYLRFLVSNLPGRSRSVFSFYNDRGECENRIGEFKNGFAADRLSCHRFRANALRLLLQSFAYNLVNLFRRQLRPSMRSAQIETLALSCSRSVRASVKQLVVSAFTWPAAGRSKISSKSPRSATPLSLFAPFDNILGEGPGGAIPKNSSRRQRAARQIYRNVPNSVPSLCCVTSNESARRFQLLMN
jgi:hypothetical protein